MSFAVRMTLHAISPLLAMRILSNSLLSSTKGDAVVVVPVLALERNRFDDSCWRYLQIVVAEVLGKNLRSIFWSGSVLLFFLLVLIILWIQCFCKSIWWNECWKVDFLSYASLHDGAVLIWWLLLGWKECQKKNSRVVAGWGKSQSSLYGTSRNFRWELVFCSYYCHVTFQDTTKSHQKGTHFSKRHPQQMDCDHHPKMPYWCARKNRRRLSLPPSPPHGPRWLMTDDRSMSSNPKPFTETPTMANSKIQNFAVEQRTVCRGRFWNVSRRSSPSSSPVLPPR